MKWSDTLATQFYPDGEKDKVASGSVAGTVLTLRLKEPSQAKTITYLQERNWSQDKLLWGENDLAALTFCEVLPLSDRDIRDAEREHIVRAPVRAKIVVPVQFIPNLIGALQEHMRVFSESSGRGNWNQGGPIH